MEKRAQVFFVILGFLIFAIRAQEGQTSLGAGEAICSVSQPTWQLGPNGEGALVTINASGTIGIKLSRFHSADRNNASAWYIQQSDATWTEYVKAQLRYTLYTLAYYSASGVPGGSRSGQHILPPEPLWKISVGPRRRTNWQWVNNQDAVLDFVVADYTFYSVIVTDYLSPSKSSSHLANPGQSESVVIPLPLDPSNFQAETGNACYDDYEYATGTGDASRPDGLYDPFTKGGKVNCRKATSNEVSCSEYHCTPGNDQSLCPALDCVQALGQYTGRVDISFLYSRVAWNFAMAANWTYDIRSLNNDSSISNPNPEGVDLAPHSRYLDRTFTVYKYFSATSAEAAHEKCVGSAGWRQLVLYDGANVNIGKSDLYLSELPWQFFSTDSDAVNQLKCDPNSRGQYLYGKNHGHCHFDFYEDVSYQVNNVAGLDARKRSFCLIVVDRWINSIFSPMFSIFDDCSIQGIGAGASDLYQSGTSCQWKDVTGLPAGMGSLFVVQNGNKAMCEGFVVCNATTGAILYDRRPDLEQEVINSGHPARPVYTYKCLHPASNLNWFANNNDTTPLLHLGPGLGYITQASKIAVGFESGPTKNNDFSILYDTVNQLYGESQQGRHCNPGNPVVLNCTIPSRSLNANTPFDSQVIRVCEASYALRYQSGSSFNMYVDKTTANGVGTACRYNGLFAVPEALANVRLSVASGSSSTLVNFTCPVARGSVGATDYEPGGYYTLYRAMELQANGGLAANVQCVVIS